MSKRETKRIKNLIAAGVDVCDLRCVSGAICKRPVCTGARKMAEEAAAGAAANGSAE